MFKMRILIYEITLLLCARSDIKYRGIDIRIVFIAAFLIALSGGSVDIISFLPGLALVIISFVFANHIGMGDGAIFILIGISYSLMESVEILLMSFLLMNLFAVGIYTLRYLKSKNIFKRFKFLNLEERVSEIPFIPFVFMAYSCFCLINYGKSM